MTSCHKPPFVVIHWLIYKLHRLCSLYEGWDPVNRSDHISWIVVANQTDRVKSVRNRCVIGIFRSGFSDVALHFCLTLVYGILSKD